MPITFEDGTVVEGRWTHEYDDLLREQRASVKKACESNGTEYVSGHYRFRRGQWEWVRGHYRNRYR